jgi:hypothetical protein
MVTATGYLRPHHDPRPLEKLLLRKRRCREWSLPVANLLTVTWELMDVKVLTYLLLLA